MKVTRLCLLGILFATTGYANELLENCKTDQVRVLKQRLILHTKLNHEPHLVLLRNVSKDELIINHVVVHPSASAGWSSYLRPGNYSALMVSQPRFSLICHKMDDGKYIPVSCNKVITTCYFSHFRDEQKVANGTFWVVEDKPLKTVMQEILARKIFLNTPN